MTTGIFRILGFTCIKNYISVMGEIVQSHKYLPYKHKGSSLIPVPTQKRPRLLAHICKPRAEESETGVSSELFGLLVSFRLVTTSTSKSKVDSN